MDLRFGCLGSIGSGVEGLGFGVEGLSFGVEGPLGSKYQNNGIIGLNIII